mmetsp:Transcript_417/g.236  ORF Transcript_417/g.236 Transcript_417/m.236 type:complete len:94 (+) Transcript_417:996-1277(+)
MYMWRHLHDLNELFLQGLSQNVLRPQLFQTELVHVVGTGRLQAEFLVLVRHTIELDAFLAFVDVVVNVGLDPVGIPFVLVSDARHAAQELLQL